MIIIYLLYVSIAFNIRFSDKTTLYNYLSVDLAINNLILLFVRRRIKCLSGKPYISITFDIVYSCHAKYQVFHQNVPLSVEETWLPFIFMTIHHQNGNLSHLFRYNI